MWLLVESAEEQTLHNTKTGVTYQITIEDGSEVGVYIDGELLFDGKSGDLALDFWLQLSSDPDIFWVDVDKMVEFEQHTRALKYITDSTDQMKGDVEK